jgi:hypothetical protein
MLGPTPERTKLRQHAIGNRHNWLLHLLVHHWISITRDLDPASARAKARASFFFDDLVVIARGNTPDPIPNSAVKTLSADGTPS